MANKCLSRSKVGKHAGNPRKRITPSRRNRKQKNRNSNNWTPQFLALRGFSDYLKTKPEEAMEIMSVVNELRKIGVKDSKLRTALIKSCWYDMNNEEAYSWAKSIVC